MSEKYANLVFVDVEARGISPVNGVMTEFGAVTMKRQSFHGILEEAVPDPGNPAIPMLTGKRIATPLQVAGKLGIWLMSVVEGRPVFVSDNPAFDFMWIAGMFDAAELPNPFGHSGRRISDFWAGLQGNWSDSQSWKQWRITPHDHNPVHDALGNVEAFEHILELMATFRGSA